MWLKALEMLGRFVTLLEATEYTLRARKALEEKMH